jgi:hypothetical protein
MSRFSEENNLELNLEKTSYVCFQKQRSVAFRAPELRLRVTNLSHRSSAKLLGVKMDENLKWNIQILNLERSLAKS